MFSDDDTMSDDALVAAVMESARTWSPPSIDDRMTWGKHKGLTYRELAARDPGYARWAATNIGGLKGQLCAEALAERLGVIE